MTEKPDISILYQDEHIVAVNKPSGIFVHRSFLDKAECFFMVQLVRDLIGQYVYPVHRLDRATSGILVFALSPEVARDLNEQFTDRRIKKHYIAMVRGHLLGEDIVDYALKEKLDKIGDKYVSEDKAPQEAQTEYKNLATAVIDKPLGKYQTVRYSLMAMYPKTGRRHQIRRHLAHLRYPIIGDVNYGDNKHNPFFAQQFGFRRLMLHALSLSFVHPVAQREISITAPLDQQWLDVMRQLDWPQSLIE
ncbi:tRNA pseudouridine(65) synthase TruC [Thalassotalea agarivorans]|uniref:tRNA pseudouridine(65) synthase TruC n=1 Tax=Thalassotalea agarivorans TaxID=349064 RepID=UPI00389B1EB4